MPIERHIIQTDGDLESRYAAWCEAAKVFWYYDKDDLLAETEADPIAVEFGYFAGVAAVYERQVEGIATFSRVTRPPKQAKSKLRRAYDAVTAALTAFFMPGLFAGDGAERKER